MQQLAFTFAPVCSLVCAHGEPWMGSHPICEASIQAKIARFEAEVQAGRYNARGYTPAEWKAKLARDANRANAEGQTTQGAA